MRINPNCRLPTSVPATTCGLFRSRASGFSQGFEVSGLDVNSYNGIGARPLDSQQLGEVPVARDEQQAVDALREQEIGERFLFGRKLVEPVEARCGVPDLAAARRKA